MVGTVYSGRNPRDIEDKILLLMNHGTGERTYNNKVWTTIIECKCIGIGDLKVTVRHIIGSN